MPSERFWFRLKILIDVMIFTGTGMYKSVLHNAYKTNIFQQFCSGADYNAYIVKNGKKL